MQVLQHAFRRLGRAPVFTLTALVTLALGIGANTAIFSVVNGVLIKPLPYPGNQQLVGIWHTAPGISGITGPLNCAPTMYFTYGEQNRSFQSLGLWSSGSVSVTGLGEPQQIQALFFTHGTLDALGVPPIAGRWFSKADDTPGTPETVILTYGYWQRRFGGSSAAIGRTLTVNATPKTIVGIMPREFRFLNSDAELILPQRFDRNKLFIGNFSYQGLARLKPGITLQQANTDVARMLGTWLKAWPAPPGISLSIFENARLGPQVQPLKKEVVGDVAATLWVLMGTIVMVLLIACANVANLMLVRAEGRRQELAIRAALGAGWGRIAREMLVESLILSLAGGALGIALAYGALRLLVAHGPTTLPRLHEITIDPLVLAFTLAISLLSGLLFGVIPVLKYASPALAAMLHTGNRSMSVSRERRRTRNSLAVVQVALALVLLIASGLMIRTFLALRSVQPGFTHPEQVQLMRVFIPEAQVHDNERVMHMQKDMLDKLAAIPGVKSVALADGVPLAGNNSNDILYAEDKHYDEGQIPPIRRYRFVSPNFFQTTGTPLIVGRDFTWTDVFDKRHVAIVSENMAREMWGLPRNALGKRIREGGKDPWREIVGVVGDVYDNGVHLKPPAFCYWPALTDGFWGESTHVSRSAVLAIRTSRAGTPGFLGETRQAIWQVNNNLPVFQVRTLQDLLDRSMSRTSFTLVLLAIAGTIALVLGVVGIYGVIAYGVSQRTREIGIRMALGAQPFGLQAMFVRHGLVLAGIGAAVGLAGAFAATRFMSSLLFGTRPLEPVTFLAVSALLIGAAALASYIPARRATTVNAADALRTE